MNNKAHLGKFKNNQVLFPVKSKVKKFRCFFFIATSPGFVKEKHLDFVKKSSKSFFPKKNNVSLFFIIKPSLGVTQKPVGARLGKGKGSLVFFVSKVFSGSTLFGIKNISSVEAKLFLKRIKGNFPISLAIKKYTF